MGVFVCGRKRDSRYRSQICGIGSFGISNLIPETVVKFMTGSFHSSKVFTKLPT